MSYNSDLQKITAMKSDFKIFMTVMWTQYLHLPNPTAVQLDIADFLQGNTQFKLVKAFRGCGKSWICYTYVLWRLWNNRQLNFLVCSGSKAKADEFSSFVLNLMLQVPFLHDLAPQKGQRFSRVQFDVAGADPDPNPSVKSAGIFGQITGSRADEIVADDIETINNSESVLQRDKLLQRIAEFTAIRKEGTKTKITFLGTPQSIDSIYNKLPSMGYTVRTWTARYPKAGIYTTDMDTLAPLIKNALEDNPELAGKIVDTYVITDSKGKKQRVYRFSEDDITLRELQYGRSGFLLQYMLDTSLSDANKYPLKLSDILFTDIAPEVAPENLIWTSDQRYIANDLAPYNCGLSGDRMYHPSWVSDKYLKYQTTIMALDISGKGSDETVAVVAKSLNGYIYIRKVKAWLNGYAPETLQGIATLAKAENVNKIIYEENYGDGMYQQLLTPVLARYYPCTIEGVRSKNQKELRIIDTLEPVLNSHRLVFDNQMVRDDRDNFDILTPVEKRTQYRLLHQLTHITRLKGCLQHDDRVDALAMAVDYFKEDRQLEQDALLLARENALKLQKASLEYYHSKGLVSNTEKLLLGLPVEYMSTEYTDRAYSENENNGACYIKHGDELLLQFYPSDSPTETPSMNTLERFKA